MVALYPAEVIADDRNWNSAVLRVDRAGIRIREKRRGPIPKGEGLMPCGLKVLGKARSETVSPMKNWLTFFELIVQVCPTEKR